jgi:hypothetical protein
VEYQLTPERITKALGICFLLTFGLLLIWFVGYLVGGDFAFRIHATMFEIDRHEYDLIMYCGMLLLKSVAVVCFLIPYVALKIVAKQVVVHG